MRKTISTPSSFTLPHTGLVFDDAMTGERAEVHDDGTATYRANFYIPEESIIITRGRALAWALRVREELNRFGFLPGSLGLTLEKELNLGNWGLFALKTTAPAELAQAAD